MSMLGEDFVPLHAPANRHPFLKCANPQEHAPSPNVLKTSCSRVLEPHTFSRLDRWAFLFTCDRCGWERKFGGG